MEELLENEVVTAKNEVIAEVIYVLDKVYKLPRMEIHSVIEQFIDLENVYVEDSAVVLLALEVFGQENFDFVDTLLFAYHNLMDVRVFTFDKKLLTKNAIIIVKLRMITAFFIFSQPLSLTG